MSDVPCLLSMSVSFCQGNEARLILLSLAQEKAGPEKCLFINKATLSIFFSGLLKIWLEAKIFDDD